MSIRGNGPLMGASLRADTQPDYYPITYASSAYAQLASHRAPPHAIGPRSLRVALREKAHALFVCPASGLSAGQREGRFSERLPAADAGSPQGFHRNRTRQSALASFPARFAFESAQIREALLNILLIGGAIGLIVTVAAAALIAPYILFFMET